jgi:hypothetical protein
MSNRVIIFLTTDESRLLLIAHRKKRQITIDSATVKVFDLVF